jgi:hypothetical protein
MMEKSRFRVTINWQGEVHEFIRFANSSTQALRHGIRALARKVGYETRYVRDYVMDSGSDRYKVEVK